ncbi:hypothetical protein BK144_05360 [Paenibacillus sp. FSL R7-0273]|nr:hypothetical protein BK144_05360 [Paenibacillus sp. FSL R7-0273]
MTIHRLFEEQAERISGHPAIRFNGISMTYGELNRQANLLAHKLIRKGVQRHDTVAVIVSRRFEMIIALLAVLKSGAAYVPVEPGYPLERKNYILSHSSAFAAITEDRERLNVPAQIILDPELPAASGPADNPDIPLKEDDLAYIMYTSGSTGMPKGVMIGHRAAVNLIRWVNRELDMGSGDKGLFITSVCFDLSVYDIFGMLAAGGTIVLCPEAQVADPKQLSSLLIDEEITFWNSVPTTLLYLVRHLAEAQPQARLPKLRQLFLSGDWIPLELARSCRYRFPQARLTALGGATEAAVWSIYYTVDEVNPKWNSIPYGKPIDGNLFYILDEAGKPVARGEAGELFIGGIGLARGYMKEPNKTAGSFLPDPFRNPRHDRMYKTGDLGRMMEDGNIEFLGRTDDQVKIRGFRVELKEVEKRLLECPGVRDAAVAARSHESGGQYLCAYLVSEHPLSLSGIKQQLSAQLPAYMLPSMFITLDKLPLNPNGKVDKKQLPAPSAAALLTESGHVTCATALELDILRLWEKVLPIRNIGAEHDFYEIGGSSIEAVALHSELLQAGFNLSFEEVTGHPTIRGQARLLEEIPLVSGGKAGERSASEAAGIPINAALKPRPFNLFYYKSCLYNSLFPVLDYFGRNPNAYLCSEIFAYSTQGRHDGELIALEPLVNEPPEAVLRRVQLNADFRHFPHSGALLAQLDDGLNRKSLFIVWVDSYYQPDRRDAYMKRHIPHTLLVYGKDEASGKYFILEHSHEHALNYKERSIAAHDLLNSCLGYREHLQSPADAYTWIEFPAEQEPFKYDPAAERSELAALAAAHKPSILGGLDALSSFTAAYALLEWTEHSQSAAGLATNVTSIIDCKRAEKHRLEQLFPDPPMLALVQAVLDGWLEIRSDLIRHHKGIMLPPERREAHLHLLQQIKDQERELAEMLCGSVQNNELGEEAYL